MEEFCNRLKQMEPGNLPKGCARREVIVVDASAAIEMLLRTLTGSRFETWAFRKKNRRTRPICLTWKARKCSGATQRS
jgi:hypothetical protein